MEKTLRRVYKVIGQHTSTSNRNWMKFGYVELQKPTRDERSWVIGMAETDFNMNNAAVHFDIHKRIAYQIYIRFAQRKFAEDRLRTKKN